MLHTQPALLCRKRWVFVSGKKISYYVVQAGLESLASNEPTSASQVAGSTCVCHRAWLRSVIVIVIFIYFFVLCTGDGT